MTPEIEGLAEAEAYPTADLGFERGLVVLAMGLPFWLIPAAGTYRLLVEQRHLGEVREQLAAYERECAAWPPREEPPTPRRRPALTPFLWAFAVLAAFGLQNSSGVWESRGALDSRLVFDRGQWWRPATALFLHADLGHLSSNLVSGFWIFSLALSAFGGRRGWLLIGLAGVAGNVGAAGLRYPGPYRSIGASTAVFGGLGLLTGRAIRAALRRTAGLRGAAPGGLPAVPAKGRLRPLFTPLAAGVILLGLYGVGGAETDVVAHACGFTAGLALGAAFGAGPSGIPLDKR